MEGIPDLEVDPEIVDAMPDLPITVAEADEMAKPKKRVGQSNRNIKYVCSKCQREVGRENLVVQRVQFLTIGVNGKLLKTRTVGWVCRNVENACLDTDPNWLAERYTGTPGQADVPAREP